MSSSREVTVQKKKDVWEQAEDEFYTESYPSGSKPPNNTHHRRPSRLAIPLPSHTARRGSLLQGRAGKTGGRRKYSLANNTVRGGGGGGGLTDTVTMPLGEPNGTTTNANDIQVAILPDLSEETILNERKTWEELQRIKSMPVPMAQKKLLKSQLTNLPKFRLKGWNHLKYMWRRYRINLSLKLAHFNSRLVFLSQSLRTIELRCGTAIANVFLFIKWTMFLNIAVSLGMLSFVIAPYITYDIIQGGKPPSPANHTTCSDSDEGLHLDLSNATVMTRFLDCCRAKYEDNRDRPEVGFHAGLKNAIKNINLGDIELWPVHFSFYHEPYISFDGFQTTYAFQTAYVLTGAAILGCSLIIVIYNVAAGVREIIKLNEGEFYKYSNLVFSGWEHFTNDKIGAAFKRKLVRDEMNLTLHTEKKKITDTGKSKREKLKVVVLRIFVNMTYVGLVVGAGYTIFELSLRLKNNESTKRDNMEEEVGRNSTSLEGFEEILQGFSVPLVISLSNLIFPIILTRLGKLEDHSRETEIALVLLRSLFIRLFTIYSLAAVFYNYTYCKPLEGHCVKCNVSTTDHTPAEYPERVRCWEGEFAAQVYKLVITELVIKTCLTFAGDPLRRLVGHICKNKVGKRIGRVSFNIVRHSLDIIYIQILAWISFYFAPFMAIMIVIYCFLIFYIKKFGVIYNVNYVPDTFRTTRTTAVFMMAKIISFVVIVFTFAFIVGFMVPSRECGPFRGKPTAWTAVEEEFEQFTWMKPALEPIFPGVAIPVALVLTLLAYYYYSVAQANRSMVETLRHLLILEGHDKQYLFSKLNSLRRKSQSNSPTTEDGATLNQP